jgi:folate-binding protein YgfZ
MTDENVKQPGTVFTEVAGRRVPAYIQDRDQEYQSARERAALFDVSVRGKIEVAGRDAGTFLHNLCTNDIKNLAPGCGCEAFLCTVKARVIAHVWAYRQLPPTTTTLWLDVDPGGAPAVMRHLDRHLISEQVEFRDRTAEMSQLYFCGPEAPVLARRTLGDRFDGLADLQHIAGTREGIVGIRRFDALGLPGFHFLGTGEAACQLWRDLTAAGATPAGWNTLETLRVEAGMPRDGADMDENRFVIEVGRTAQAISYAKGCYLGQEPIVMARDRGHVNRMLLGVELSGGPVVAGTKLFRGGEEVGVVTSSVFSPRLGTAIGLAYLRRGSQEPGTTLEVETPEGNTQAVVRKLPFVVAAAS